MRGNRNSYNSSKIGVHAPSYTNVNTTNVTNIYAMSNTARMSVSGSRGHQKRRHGGKGSRHRHGSMGRPPKLMRYCASLGFLDGDVVYGMNNEDICRESARVMSYSARGAANSVGRIAKDAVGLAECTCNVAKGVFDLVGLAVRSLW